MYGIWELIDCPIRSCVRERFVIPWVVRAKESVWKRVVEFEWDIEKEGMVSTAGINPQYAYGFLE